MLKLKLKLAAIAKLVSSAFRIGGFQAPYLIWQFVNLYLLTRSNRKTLKTEPEIAPQLRSCGQVDQKRQSGDIILPVFNNFTDVKALLHQLARDEFPASRTIIIDDASTDPGIKKLLNSFCAASPDRLLITNDINLGFVKSINRGFNKSHSDVAILNTDIVLPKGGLRRIFARLWDSPDIATVTPFTNSGFLMGFPDPLKPNQPPWDATINEIDKSFHTFQNIASPEIVSGVGFCMAISRTILDKLGVFDESYSPGYGEETDFCLRAHELGYRNVAAPDTFVLHHGGGSFGNTSVQTLRNRNVLRVLKNHPGYIEKLRQHFTSTEIGLIRFLALTRLSIIRSGKRPDIIVSTNDLRAGRQAGPSLIIDFRNKKCKATLHYLDEKYSHEFSSALALFDLLMTYDITDRDSLSQLSDAI